MKLGRRVIFFSAGFLAFAVAIGALLYVQEPEYAYLPPAEQIMLPNHHGSLGILQSQEEPVFDLWGELISGPQASILAQSSAGSQLLAPENGAIEITDELIALGRESFYTETFGNEVFLTDILGIFNGPLRISNIAKAIMELKGEATDNLQVELAESVQIGNRTFKKGEKIDTGLDVAKGALTPLGMPMKFSEGRLKVGISCAACHASVDKDTGKVLEGVPNANLNAGLMLALASNSAAYFTNTEIATIEKYLQEEKDSIVTSDGSKSALPDIYAFEKAVDETLLKWPLGSFDSTFDLKANPTQIPDTFTFGDHPYGWSGFAMAGPFKGLSVLNNNVHAQNSDIIAKWPQSKELFEIDPEVFIGTILQNAANPAYRYHKENDEQPSKFWSRVDPTPDVPGVNKVIKPPNFPKLSLISPNGTLISSPGFNVFEQNNAMSAFQNTLVPPKPNIVVDKKTMDLGRQVFQRAGCVSCHSGAAFTNNRIIPVAEIGTSSARAAAFKATERIFDTPLLYSPDTPVPLPADPKVLQVPTDHLDQEQIKLAYAHGDSLGGYKVKGLIGLYWTAPYLHDGGVAVGADESKELGVPGTLMKGIKPDPKNSLLALVDQKLREKVIAANSSSKDLQDVHVQGIGHEYWVDQTTGFTKEEQEALINYLLMATSN